LTVHPKNGAEFPKRFEVPETQRQRLLKGLDAIAETLQHEAAIRAHEGRAPRWLAPQSA
jgi:3-isopropylmalate dehydratase small subunit